MSYVKFDEEESSVYLFGGVMNPPPDDTHVIVCWLCLLNKPYEFQSRDFETKQAALDHLEEHRQAGHVVPQVAFDRIEEDDWVS
jgi:hypothetical protein